MVLGKVRARGRSPRQMAKWLDPGKGIRDASLLQSSPYGISVECMVRKGKVKRLLVKDLDCRIPLISYFTLTC